MGRNRDVLCNHHSIDLYDSGDLTRLEDLQGMDGADWAPLNSHEFIMGRPFCCSTASDLGLITIRIKGRAGCLPAPRPASLTVRCPLMPHSGSKRYHGLRCVCG
jgi:hypothetical protein